jgi:hypothetical protein
MFLLHYLFKFLFGEDYEKHMKNPQNKGRRRK